MFEAVYIADTTNSLVFEYLINLSCPKFNHLKNLIELDKYDPSKPALAEVNSEYFVAFQKLKSLVIYLLCSNKNSLNPIMPFVFIDRLVEVMEDNFGRPLAVTKIDANIDTLTLLLNEMIEDGMPNVTDFNRLKDLVPVSNLFTKLLSTGNELASAVSNKSLSSLTHNTRKAEILSNGSQQAHVPWRRANVKYTNNEMYVDVVETINVILKPLLRRYGKESNVLASSKGFDSAFYSASSLRTSSKLVPIVATIDGQINFISHLTGVPYLQMILKSSGLDMGLPSFHECIEMEKWMNDKNNLSFIPPDGNSTLMTYQIDLDNLNRREQKEMMGIVDIDYQHGLGTNQNEFEIRLFINGNASTSKIENLSIEIHCASGNQDNSSNVDEDSHQGTSVSNIRVSRITHGDFSFKGSGKGEWNLRSISTGTQPMIHGTIISDGSFETLELSTAIKEYEPHSDGTNHQESPAPAMEAIKPVYLKMSFSYKGCVPSGLKVDSLKILSAKGLGDTVKPYKGVKYITKAGNFIIRS